MIRTIVSIALFVLLIVGCVWIYRIVTHDQVPGNGDVMVRSSTEHDQMETGATFIGDKPIEAHPTPSRSDAPGTINTEPVADYGKSGNANDSVTTQPTPVAPQPVSKPYPQTPYEPQPVATPAYSPSSATDTIAPNPPNGMAFAGTGAYQWYRQGDLTWRVDTKNGSSCIDYATMEEWSKPLVYSHGCGGSGRWRRYHAR